MKSFTKQLVTAAALVMVAGFSLQAISAEGFEKKNKLVIQVSSDDAQTQALALNNAVNIQKVFGVDNVDVEIVAYGPGLSLLTKKSPEAERVKSLASQEIHFSACGNTMEAIEKKTGKKPELTDGVKVVPGGVVRIMELQNQGYAYIRP